MKKALVIGFGSIGKLHSEVLTRLGFEVRIVSAHMPVEEGFFSNLEAAYDDTLDYVVVASRTSDHLSDIKKLTELGYTGKVLVEKPLFDTVPELNSTAFENLYVGYNLRFHPGVEAMVRHLEGRKILTVQHYVGQHLSQWRPGTDHKQSYSSSASQGGGVLRDLSHELDLMLHLFGRPYKVTGMGGRFGEVTIDAEDAFGVVMSLERCPLAVVQMNCLDWHGGRHIRVVCEDTTIVLDFRSGGLQIGNDVEHYPTKRPDTYERMHQEILQGDATIACSFAEGLEVLQQIEALEKL